jgi:hypothetical protein
MDADWVARGTALSSTAISFLSLGWNAVVWRGQGPIVKVRASCGGRGDQMKISGRLYNSGRSGAVIEGAEFAWLSSAGGNSTAKRLSCQLPPGNVGGIAFPLSLPAGTGHEFTITDIKSIDLGLEVALHDARWTRLTFRSASNRRARGVVKFRK